MQITKNFSDWEIRCPCCGDTNIRLAIMEIAQAIRDELAQPVYVPEGGGKRCMEYHLAECGDYPSAHCTGEAIDLYIKPFHIRNMLKIAYLGKEFGALRIGLYPDSTVKTVHLDLWEGKSESWVRIANRYVYFKYFEQAVKYVKERW